MNMGIYSSFYHFLPLDLVAIFQMVYYYHCRYQQEIHCHRDIFPCILYSNYNVQSSSKEIFEERIYHRFWIHMKKFGNQILDRYKSKGFILLIYFLPPNQRRLTYLLPNHQKHTFIYLKDLLQLTLVVYLHCILNQTEGGFPLFHCINESSKW